MEALTDIFSFVFPGELSFFFAPQRIKDPTGEWGYGELWFLNRIQVLTSRPPPIPLRMNDRFPGCHILIENDSFPPDSFKGIIRGIFREIRVERKNAHLLKVIKDVE